MATYQRDLSIPQENVNAIHNFLKRVWEENSEIHLQDRIRFETAIIEIASNVIMYAEATSGINLHIKLEINPDRIEATLVDNGEMADLQLDEHIMPDELSESGRGIPLTRALVDKFTYQNYDGKNIWRIEKRLPQ